MTAPVTTDDLRCADAPALAIAYGLRLAAARPLPGGLENTHIVLDTTTGSVVATCLHKKNHDQAGAYAIFLQQVAALPGLRVPRLRRRLDGDWVSDLRDRPVIVCDHLAGHRPDQLPEPQLHQMGRILAELHRHTTDLTTALTPHLRITPTETETLHAMSADPLGSWARRTWDAVGDVPQRAGHRSFIHSDLFPDNLLLQDGQAPALLDWEDGCRDLSALDLGVAVLGLCSPGRFLPERARLLLTGYRDAHGPGLDLDLIRDAALYAAVLITLRRHRWQATGHLSAEPARSATAMARTGAAVARLWPSACP
jgi:homoserine kinase type II